jgi:Porin subfamily
MRQQTEYGTLRSYIDVGAGVQTNNGGYGGSATTQPLGANASYGNTTVYTDRAFLQFAGFTVGRIRSFFDMVNPGAYSIASQRFSGDTGGGSVLPALPIRGNWAPGPCGTRCRIWMSVSICRGFI